MPEVPIVAFPLVSCVTLDGLALDLFFCIQNGESSCLGVLL